MPKNPIKAVITKKADKTVAAMLTNPELHSEILRRLTDHMADPDTLSAIITAMQDFNNDKPVTAVTALMPDLQTMLQIYRHYNEDTKRNKKAEKTAKPIKKTTEKLLAKMEILQRENVELRKKLTQKGIPLQDENQTWGEILETFQEQYKELLKLAKININSASKEDQELIKSYSKRHGKDFKNLAKVYETNLQQECEALEQENQGFKEDIAGHAQYINVGLLHITSPKAPQEVQEKVYGNAKNKPSAAQKSTKKFKLPNTQPPITAPPNDNHNEKEDEEYEFFDARDNADELSSAPEITSTRNLDINNHTQEISTLSGNITSTGETNQLSKKPQERGGWITNISDQIKNAFKSWLSP